VQLSMTRLEAALLLSVAAAALLACLGPAAPQYVNYHAFADQRAAWGLPHGMDVLSNLPFAVGGIWGLVTLYRQGFVPGVRHSLALLFFAGLVLAAIGSSIYHWQPDDTRLAYDRLGMVAAFAGLLGMATADRMSERAGVLVAQTVLLWGPLSIAVWATSANLLPWAVLQGGGMLLVLWLACCRPLEGAWGLSLWTVIAVYTLAKLLELGDHQVFMWTGGMLSGHSLKHVAAACAAWPVGAALQTATRPVHNGKLAEGPAPRT